jgi:trimethylamine:corrinoid methyltransferase-like protein/methanogenic corrinoid protein MtbC1
MSDSEIRDYQKSRRRSRRERMARKEAEAPPESAPPGPVAAPAGGLARSYREKRALRPLFAYLDEERIAALRTRAMALLAERGFTVGHEAARRALGRAGARLGPEGAPIRLPTELVEEALGQAPRCAQLCAKRPERDLLLPAADGTFHLRSGTGAHGYVEPDGSYRKLVLDDVTTIARLGEGLSELGFIAHPFVNDVPELTSDIHGFARLIAKTSKHVWIQPYNAANVDYLLRIAALAGGGEAALKARPIASCIATSFTPLEIKDMDVEAIIQSGRFGLPIHACSLPTAGGTAPVTVAGSVVMAAAEILAMVVLAHLLAPATPVIATPLMFTLDMRSGRSLQSSIEALQAASAAVQLMKQGFGLPCHTYGAGSDTPDVDGQSQAERAMLALMVALSGADILGAAGQLECATVFSPLQLVIDDELAGMVRQYLHTPEVDDESLGWEPLLAVPPGGHFLDAEHTLAHCLRGGGAARHEGQGQRAHRHHPQGGREGADPRGVGRARDPRGGACRRPGDSVMTAALYERLDAIYEAVLDYEGERVAELVAAELERGTELHAILNDALIAAMDEVGELFSEGVLFVPEMLMAAKAMKAGLAILRPLLTASDIEPVGTVVMGTVHRDLHDIGKNLVGMMLEGGGFKVVDLGVDVAPEDFASAVAAHGADVVGMSALLTTTMPNMKKTVAAFRAAGFNGRIMVGGAPVTGEFAEVIGADGYADDAPRAVALAKRFVLEG